MFAIQGREPGLFGRVDQGGSVEQGATGVPAPDAGVFVQGIDVPMPANGFRNTPSDRAANPDAVDRFGQMVEGRRNVRSFAVYLDSYLREADDAPHGTAGFVYVDEPEPARGAV